MKVLIVDANPQSDVSAGFGYRDCDESNETLTALMDTVMKDEDIPSDCYIRHQAEGIDIICSNIIDCMPSLGMITILFVDFRICFSAFGILSANILSTCEKAG